MDPDSEYSSEEHNDAVASPHRINQESEDEETSAASLNGGSEGSSSEESEDERSSVSQSQGPRSPLKRPADDTTSYRPFKRQRAELNFGYLELLNKEIEDAAHRTSFSDLPDPSPAQIGLTYWSSLEKRKFFESVARLGRHDIPGIAASIGSKSVAEVSHYLDILREAGTARQKSTKRPALEPAEYPAAVELSQQCCHAQEEAADEISLRQEAREVQREENRWGEIWDITPKVARKFNRDIQEGNGVQRPRFAQLFYVSRWLELSSRMFMNSSIPGNNWKFISDEPPSVWATAFEDYHSLAVSITRRLVQTTLFMAMSRIRSKTAGGSRIRDMVQLQDAEAAITSLGMTSKTNELWLKSAQRLRLDVYEDPPVDGEDHDEDPMTYDEVERELSSPQVSDSPQPESPFTAQSLFVTQQQFDESEEYSDVDDVSSDDSDPFCELGLEEREIRKEAREVMKYMFSGRWTTKRQKDLLRARIATERQKEKHADECDDYASYKAETEMWNVLQKKPPMELPKKQDPGPPKRSTHVTKGQYFSGGDWACNSEYYSEWETIREVEDDIEELESERIPEAQDTKELVDPDS